MERALVLANPDSAFWQKEKEVQYKQGHIVSGDLSANVVAVCGIVLPRLKLVSEEQQVCNPILSLYLFFNNFFCCKLTLFLLKSHWDAMDNLGIWFLFFLCFFFNVCCKLVIHNIRTTGKFCCGLKQ